MKQYRLAILLLLNLSTAIYAGVYSGGSGTLTDPYKISNTNDLVEIGNQPGDFSSHFVLTADINMSGITNFKPIGYYATTQLTSAIPFTGQFDGKGHTISYLSITTNKPGIGLFGIVTNGVTVIKNITLVSPIYTTTGSTNSRAGGLVGCFEGLEISNCHVINPTIIGNAETGGLLGTTWSQICQISNCSVQNGSIRGNNRVGGFAGGITPNAHVFNCWSSAEVYSKGTTASTTLEVGGFAGYINSTSNKITLVECCYATGNVIGATISDNVGGFTGSNRATISNCFATGNVSGRSSVGGFSGYHTHNGTPTYTVNCFSTGMVMGTGDDVGGFNGYKFSYNTFWENCYWNTQTSGMAISSEGYPYTTDQMQDQANYDGWDFANTWIMSSPDSYPRLRSSFNKADLDFSDSVNLHDFNILALAWGSVTGNANYNPACDLENPADGVIDILDLAVFADNWLAQ